MKQSQAIQVLRQAGIVNPPRLVKLIEKTIEFFGLNLSGLTVLTEAASGAYVVTPVIAELAGAERVLALTQDSRYASADSVMTQTRALEVLCGVEGGAEIHTERSYTLFSQADIVTNLGFVRPIDAKTIAVMKPTAVVPLMCEAWEYRPGDVDLEACHVRGIEVIGTNEDYPGLDVFAYSGWLALKLLFNAQIEVHKSKVVIVSGDKFGHVIKQRLECCGISVELVADLRAGNRANLASADVVLVADYKRDDMIIGPDGDMTGQDLARLAPAITVIRFAGRIDERSLMECGIVVYPHCDVGAHRMTLTLADLGPRPVVELHTAGLKVGEIAVRARMAGATIGKVEQLLSNTGIGQILAIE
jgi:hypothetical protein